MKKKYYAVKKGIKPGIYTNWQDCKDQVHGYKGAIYKSFLSEEEAKAFVNEEELVYDGGPRAYVDGSYSKEKGLFSWGLVLLTDEGQEIFSGLSSGSHSSYWNVAGELYGAINAVKIAIERSYDSITIYHDYTGIRHWALGEWKRNNDLTSWYYDFMQEAKSHITINFIKVKAHSGDVHNELADELAKEAIRKGGEND